MAVASGSADRKWEPIVYCPGQILFTSNVSFGGLNGRMSQQELDLLQFTTRGVAQASASSPEVVGSQGLDSNTGRTPLDDVPDDILGDSVAPYCPVLSNRTE